MIRYLALASLFLVGCASVNVHKSPSFSFDSVNKIGVSELLVGSLSAPPCTTVMPPVNNTYVPTQQCSASMSMKLIRVANGETLWQANASHSLGGVNYSQAKLTQYLMEKISEQVPRK